MGFSMCTSTKHRMYLAAKYDKRKALLPVAAILMLQGHVVTAKWLDGSHDGTSKADSLTYAGLDLRHIDDCDTLVLFNLPIGNAEQSSGRNVEFGYALATHKTTIVVGPGNSIFYELADEYYETVEEFLEVYAPRRGDGLRPTSGEAGEGNRGIEGEDYGIQRKS